MDDRKVRQDDTIFGIEHAINLFRNAHGAYGDSSPEQHEKMLAALKAIRDKVDAIIRGTESYLGTLSEPEPKTK